MTCTDSYRSCLNSPRARPDRGAILVYIRHHIDLSGALSTTSYIICPFLDYYILTISHNLGSPPSYHTLIFDLMSSRNLYLYNAYIYTYILYWSYKCIVMWYIFTSVGPIYQIILTFVNISTGSIVNISSVNSKAPVGISYDESSLLRDWINIIQ